MKNLFTKKRIFFSVAAFLLVVTFVASCARRDIKNITSRGKTIVCFGDSLTYGIGAKSAQSYPALLAKMMRIPVINAGIEAETTSEALKRLQADVLERDPLLVIIEFGGNDFLRKVPRDITVENVREMVEKIQEKAPWSRSLT
jgi:acyl-CoA thioesterase-1